jgi:hypothetical protein
MFNAADAVYQRAVKQNSVDPNNIVIMGYSI